MKNRTWGCRFFGRTRAEAYRNLLSAMRDLLDVYADEAPKSTAPQILR
jgi:hypothetical protein